MPKQKHAMFFNANVSNGTVLVDSKRFLCYTSLFYGKLRNNVVIFKSGSGDFNVSVPMLHSLEIIVNRQTI